ncbi:hypothetical protein V6N12_069171 [Hibiscus sabdariffa]|uniref:Uncharacterized protein n=1 Tax=Hibiscus sabdariffa TaxID=183260 RepID=A0ABR2FD70_9ROSI
MVAYSVVVSVLWTPPPERHRRSSRVILVESLKIGGRKATVVRGFYTPLSSFQKCSDVTSLYESFQTRKWYDLTFYVCVWVSFWKLHHGHGRVQGFNFYFCYDYLQVLIKADMNHMRALEYCCLNVLEVGDEGGRDSERDDKVIMRVQWGWLKVQVILDEGPDELGVEMVEARVWVTLRSSDSEEAILKNGSLRVMNN